MMTPASIAALAALAATAAAHGLVTSVSADGKTERGYTPDMQWTDPNGVVAGWTTPENLQRGFIDTANFGTDDMICHKGATNAKGSLTVNAGSTVEIQWTEWPESHHGPVIDYLASCNGKCSEVQKTSLRFFKIAEKGLLDNSYAPGRWASDELIKNGNKWYVEIPTDIPSGEYVLRHEIIALHAAHDPYRTEAYPQCINLKVTGGDDTKSVPQGTPATQLYSLAQSGIGFNIHRVVDSYEIPGPKVYAARDGGAGSPAPVKEEEPTPKPGEFIEEPAEEAPAEEEPAGEEPVEEEPAGEVPVEEEPAKEPTEKPLPVDETPKPVDTPVTPEPVTPEPEAPSCGSSSDEADLQELLAWWRRRRNARKHKNQSSTYRRHVRDFVASA